MLLLAKYLESLSKELPSNIPIKPDNAPVPIAMSIEAFTWCFLGTVSKKYWDKAVTETTLPIGAMKNGIATKYNGIVLGIIIQKIDIR